MGAANRWSARRYLILLMVFAIHAGLMALLLPASQIRMLHALPENSVQVVSLAAEQPPRVKIAPVSLRPLNSAASISIGPPVSITPSPPMSPGAGGSSTGEGSDVDWRAEARRALSAFDIRSHLPSNHQSVSARPEDESWLPSGPHRTGEQYKTAAGDWIVWINSNCYQIASSGGGGRATDAEPSQITCRHQPTTPP